MLYGAPTITATRTATRRSSFVKRISYLANKDETPALSFLHFKRYERQGTELQTPHG